MNVILLQDVENLGLRGDVVSVARGYARNFLLPRKLAEVATTAKVEELRKRDARRTLQEARSADQAETISETLRKTVLRFEMKAGPTGALFGSVTPSDIADEIWRVRKIRIDRRKIELPDPLKRIGSFLVPIQIFEGVSVEVKTLVVPEGGELPPEEAPSEQPSVEQEPQDGAEAEAEATTAEPALEPAPEAEVEAEAVAEDESAR
jgi:large subunit ribosomal protein L9